MPTGQAFGGPAPTGQVPAGSIPVTPAPVSSSPSGPSASGHTPTDPVSNADPQTSGGDRPDNPDPGFSGRDLFGGDPRA